MDFTDRNTCEGLYMEYYNIIKEKERFQLTDLYAAKNRVTVERSRLSGSDIEESDEEEVSDYDGVESEKESMKTHKTKRSGKQKSAVRTPLKSKKQEFIGWASSSLIEFLNSVGKCTNRKLSQHEVSAIITDYVKENKLFLPGRRKMIKCDARLQPLFKRNIINRSKVYNLLGAHFAENHDESEEDTEDDDAGIQDVCKRQRNLDEESKSPKKQLKRNVPWSCYAAIVVENVKLIYLKRSLVQELLKQPESVDEKVFGCFVRVKSDPNDYLARNCHQLRQVKGKSNLIHIIFFQEIIINSCKSKISLEIYLMNQLYTTAAWVALIYQFQDLIEIFSSKAFWVSCHNKLYCLILYFSNY